MFKKHNTIRFYSNLNRLYTISDSIDNVDYNIPIMFSTYSSNMQFDINQIPKNLYCNVYRNLSKSSFINKFVNLNTSFPDFEGTVKMNAINSYNSLKDVELIGVSLNDRIFLEGTNNSEGFSDYFRVYGFYFNAFPNDYGFYLIERQVTLDIEDEKNVWKEKYIRTAAMEITSDRGRMFFEKEMG